MEIITPHGFSVGHGVDDDVQEVPGTTNNPGLPTCPPPGPRQCNILTSRADYAAPALADFIFCSSMMNARRMRSRVQCAHLQSKRK
jgi:hypothetical protein